MARARRILALLLCTQQSQNDINGPKMRAATFTNRALVALLAALVIGSTLGNSTEPARVRITTWNLEWFPNGSAHDTTPEVQAQRIAAAATNGSASWEQLRGGERLAAFRSQRWAGFRTIRL